MSQALRRVFAPPEEGPWLFGRRVDLLVFGGSTLLSLGLLALGHLLGIVESDSPQWVWILFVLGCDVAHVWSTIFRVYLDREEVAARPALHLGTPLLAFLTGWALHAHSQALFWTVVAYAAVFHFVRQQYGWVALYRRRAGEPPTGPDRWLDEATIYAATVYPVLWWHAHLPRRFAWMMEGDFVLPVPAALTETLQPLYWGLLLLWGARQVYRWHAGRPLAPGKVLVVTSTWLLWWLGIVVYDGDYAFTVTNVIHHGVPYLALTWRYGRARGAERPRSLLGILVRGGLPTFLGVVLALAFLEEWAWDRWVWGERPWLFGEEALLHGPALAVLAALLATPQLTHYVLDAFVWKVGSGRNPRLARELTPPSARMPDPAITRRRRAARSPGEPRRRPRRRSARPPGAAPRAPAGSSRRVDTR